MTMTETLDRTWLDGRVRQLVEDGDELEPGDNLVDFGLDSIRVMKFASELKERGIEVSFEALAREPTLDAWWALIAARRGSV